MMPKVGVTHLTVNGPHLVWFGTHSILQTSTITANVKKLGHFSFKSQFLGSLEISEYLAPSAYTST